MKNVTRQLKDPQVVPTTNLLTLSWYTSTSSSLCLSFSS
jgi:hypothetical protein